MRSRVVEEEEEEVEKGAATMEGGVGWDDNEAAADR
jgi:hypothetical protein